MPYNKSAAPRAAMMFVLLLFTGFRSVASASPATSGADPEAFKVEVSGSAWLVDSSGTIQASGTPIDLRSDLAVSEQQPTFFGKFVLKPGRKHRIIVEGTPIRLGGLNTVDRDIVYRGQTFPLNTTVQSSADLNYLFAGYQYDLLSGSMGHLGLSVGGAYLDATGRINSVGSVLGVTENVSATKSETVGLPLAGVESRLFPLPGRKILEVEGGLRGMAVGSYGHYLELSASAGLNLGPFAFLAGYRLADYDLHQSSGVNPDGVNIHLKGPIFTLQFRH